MNRASEASIIKSFKHCLEKHALFRRNVDCFVLTALERAMVELIHVLEEATRKIRILRVFWRKLVHHMGDIILSFLWKMPITDAILAVLERLPYCIGSVQARQPTTNAYDGHRIRAVIFILIFFKSYIKEVKKCAATPRVVV